MLIAVNPNTDLHTGTWSSAADEGEQRMRISSEASSFKSASYEKDFKGASMSR